MRKTDLKCERLKHGANGPIRVANNANTLRTVRSGCEQRKRVAVGPIGVANNSKIVAETKNEARETEKSHPTTQNDFARTFSDSFPTQLRCKRRKRTANGPIAVQNDTNGPQTHSSQFKTTQTDRKRTHRSSKRRKHDCCALVAVQRHRMACNPATQSSQCCRQITRITRRGCGYLFPLPGRKIGAKSAIARHVRRRYSATIPRPWAEVNLTYVSLHSSTARRPGRSEGLL